MNITVKLFSSFRLNAENYHAERGLSMSMEEDVTVSELIKMVKIDANQTPIIVVINGKLANPKTLLNDGDNISIFPLTAGG